jgi:hypothetical protein
VLYSFSIHLSKVRSVVVLILLIVSLSLRTACQQAIKLASAELFVDVRYHQPLFSVIPYLPECVLIGRGLNIGGIQYANDPRMSPLEIEHC